MSHYIRYTLITLIGFLLFDAKPLLADQVVRVSSEGTLELQSGKKVELLGIKVIPEGLSLFPTLLGGKEVDLKFEGKERDYDEFRPIPVYLFVDTDQLSLPFSEKVQPEQKRVMINELLLMLGAAKVENDASFEHKESFLKHESEARERGEGIWSYEDPEAVLPSRQS